MTGIDNSSLVDRRIVYVTGEWSGFKEVLDSGGILPNGMPAFFLPLVELVKRRASITLIVVSRDPAPPVRLCKGDLVGVYVISVKLPGGRSLASGLGLIPAVAKMFVVVRRAHPEFIYAHGTAGAIGLIVAKMLSVPRAARIYGTNIYYDLLVDIGALRFLLRAPLLYLCYFIRSEFILITNDGSQGDRIYHQIGNRNTKMYYWRNGLHKMPTLSEPITRKKNLLLYPSRIAPKKNQIAAIRILHDLVYKQNLDLRLKLIGYVSSKTYHAELLEKARSLGVLDRLEIESPVSREKLFDAMSEAAAVLSLQRVSNLSNVLIEALSVGAIVISYRERELQTFLADGTSAVLIDDICGAHKRISDVLLDEQLLRNMRISAKRATRNSFQSWSGRVDKEIELISRALATRAG